MHRSLKISAVEYLNTQPFIKGLELFAPLYDWMIEKDTPAECARKLKEGQADIGLVPVAAIAQLEQMHIITDWGIAADGPVQSVLLLSQVEINQVEQIWLDYQSRTSNTLLQILLKDYFKLDITCADSKEGYEDHIEGTIAAVVIGDRALKIRDRFRFRYDLAALWKEMTGLPFVFARWVGSRDVDLAVEQALNKAFESGMDHRRDIASEEQKNYEKADISRYLMENIHYRLGPKYHDGLNLFMEKQSQLVLYPTT